MSDTQPVTEPFPAPIVCPRCGGDLFNVPRTDAFCFTTRQIEPSFVDDMTINCAECGREMEDERTAIADAYYEAKRIADGVPGWIINPEILAAFRNFPGKPSPQEWQDEWLALVVHRMEPSSKRFSSEIVEMIAALAWWDQFGKPAPPQEAQE